MGGILCGALSKIRWLIKGSLILLVAIFLHSDAGLGPRNVALEEELSQLDWSALTPPAHTNLAWCPTNGLASSILITSLKAVADPR
jgi:hypothetical protein